LTRAVEFQLDEHLSPEIARALRRRGISALTTHEAGLLGRSDREILAWCHAGRRVIVTFDADYLRLHYDNTPHYGIVFITPGTRLIGQIIDALVLVHGVMETDEMVGTLQYL
jgi:predicted nuclease of predicted toxin-antitoxin system